MRSKAPQAVGAILQEMVRDLGIDQTLQQYNVLTSWASIVGEKIARVTMPQRIENGILFVQVSSAPWRAELTMRRMEILEKVNAAAGRQVVREIRFR
jgi:predicted nucleic acid-binding Zn ribbon protein